MSAVLKPPVKMTPVASPNRTPPPAVRPVTLVPEYHRFSVTDYERMVETGILDADAPVELLEGLVVTKMPRNPAHDGTLDLVEGIILACLPPGWFIRTQRSVRLPGDSTPEPDLAVVRGDRKTYLTRHPGPADVGLIVEIANTSLKKDVETKSRVYATAGIPAYWIVNLTDRVVMTFSKPKKIGTNTEYCVQKSVLIGEVIEFILEENAIAKINVSDLII